ncbi:hypothetical protein KIW84_063177 [Lathyrus oleraceus]|uniref:Uncharacterized protein n=1 Tax=Pisum sativum TaxID=3888 RepID=A0A9D4WAF7_PEA|nr:hypothetical protein KIW84_063177 [Pisum sativum]
MKITFSSQQTLTFHLPSQGPSLAPSRKDKGKGKSDEGSPAPDPLNLGRLVDTPREKKLLLNFRNRPPTPQKYGNMSTFPSLSFDFPTLFHFQGFDTLIADSGPIYPDLWESEEDAMVSESRSNVVMTGGSRGADLVLCGGVWKVVVWVRVGRREVAVSCGRGDGGGLWWLKGFDASFTMRLDGKETKVME